MAGKDSVLTLEKITGSVCYVLYGCLKALNLFSFELFHVIIVFHFMCSVLCAGKVCMFMIVVHLLFMIAGKSTFSAGKWGSSICCL